MYIYTEFDSGNLNAFYRYYYPGFVIYARRFLGHEEEYLAEDIVQDAVVKAWEHRGRFENHNAFKSFLYATIKNRIINVIRKKKIQDKYTRQLEDSMEWEQAMIDQEAVTMLYNAARELPLNLREVYRLSFLENKKVYEVSEILGIPERTVKKYRADILVFFRSKLGALFFLYFF